MLPDPKVKCPATGFAKSCRAVLSECDCPKFVSIKGTDPQTGAIADRHGCIDGFLPLLLIENAQIARQIAAEVHELRNDVFKADEKAREETQERFAALTNGQGHLILR